MPLPLISKILEDASKRSTKKEIVEFLKTHAPNEVLRGLLSLTFDNRVKWLLPKTNPPYKPAEVYDDNGGLYQQNRKLHYFLEGSDVHPIKRETMFIEMLETVAPQEALLLLAVKSGKLPYKGVTKRVVQEAFPGLIPEGC